MNLTWNALIFGLAVIIPGGLIVYFGWKSYKAYQESKIRSAPSHKEAVDAFRKHYPLIE